MHEWYTAAIGLALSATGFAIVTLLVAIESHLNTLREQHDQTELLRPPVNACEYKKEFDVQEV